MEPYIITLIAIVVLALFFAGGFRQGIEYKRRCDQKESIRRRYFDR